MIRPQLPADAEDAIDELRAQLPAYDTTTLVTAAQQLSRLATKAASTDRERRSRSAAAHAVARRLRDMLIQVGAVAEGEPEAVRKTTQEQSDILDGWVTDTLYNIDVVV